jgi:hypothetical protein
MGEPMMQGKLNLMALFAVFGAGLAVASVFGQQVEPATDYKAPLEVPRLGQTTYDDLEDRAIGAAGIHGFYAKWAHEGGGGRGVEGAL